MVDIVRQKELADLAIADAGIAGERFFELAAKVAWVNADGFQKRRHNALFLGKKASYLDITSKSVKDAYKSNLQ